MQNRSEVYLFGQILGTHSFLLKGGFLQPDEYSEIGEQYFLPGGETGTEATCCTAARERNVIAWHRSRWR